MSAAAGAAAPALRRARGSRRDRLAGALCALALVVALGTLGFIPLYILTEAAPFLLGRDLWAFLAGEPWSPLMEPPQLGILHAWVATVYVTVIALLIAVPLGFGIGLFAVEVAPGWVRGPLRVCLDLLAGIPSVVYGFFGYVTLIPLFEWMFGMATGESVLAAGIIVAVMVLPFIASTSAEAFAAVPGALRESALCLGITRAHMVRRVVVVQALPGMFAGVALGFARAIGETLAALLLIGNSVQVPLWPTDRGQTLTGLIATDLGESPLGTPIYHSLFAAGAVLMLVVLVINTGIWWMKQRLIQREA